MAIPDINFKTYLTSGSGTGSDGGGSQNDPDSSLGGWRSTTEVSPTIGNLFEVYTQAQLSSSTRYRCICLYMDHGSASQAISRLASEHLSSLKSGMTVTYGIQTNDSTTVAPTCTDTTAPAGITFVSIQASTGDDTADHTTAEPIGPLNSAGDGSTDLTLDNAKRVFVYIKIVCSGASGAFDNGVDNRIGLRSIGTDSI